MCIKAIIALIVPSVVLGACAGGGANTIHGIETPEVPTETPEVQTERADLTPVAPRLPSLDRHLAEIREDAGPVASAVLELCVGPDGRVNDVNIVHRSSSRAYDNALLSDVAKWRFTGGLLTFAQADTCEAATISYRVSG